MPNWLWQNWLLIQFIGRFLVYRLVIWIHFSKFLTQWLDPLCVIVRRSGDTTNMMWSKESSDFLLKSFFGFLITLRIMCCTWRQGMILFLSMLLNCSGLLSCRLLDLGIVDTGKLCLKLALSIDIIGSRPWRKLPGHMTCGNNF